MKFDLSNYEDHILDFLEGQLSESEIDAYLDWKAAHPHLQAEEELMRQTFLTPEVITYSNKEALKSFGKTEKSKLVPVKVVPLYRRAWTMGIAAAAVLGLFFWMNMNDTVISPNDPSMVSTPASTPEPAKVERVEIADETLAPMDEDTPVEAFDVPEVNEQGMFANLNKIADKAKEIVANNDNDNPKKKAGVKKGTLRNKRPERFTKEDINLDRRYNNTIAEVSKPETTIEESVVLESVLEQAEDVAELSDFPSEKIDASKSEKIMEDVIAATDKNETAPSVDTSPEVITETAADPVLAEEPVVAVAEKEQMENQKVLSGWQKVRASIQDEESVLGFAAREVADFVTPSILEKEDKPKRKNISVDINIARTNLGKTIKKLRNK